MHVFLSYAKKDTYNLALQLDTEINQLLGVTCWVDRDLKPGKSWALQIQKQIQECDVMVVLISPDVNRVPDDETDLSFVLNEITFAQNLRKHIIPVLAQSTYIPISIVSLQYIDLTNKFEQGQADLMNRICDLAGSNQLISDKDALKLLEWTDSRSGRQLKLPIDRNAPIKEQIHGLRNLQELNLIDNYYLHELPPELWKLVNLQGLSLRKTRIAELPSEIINLVNLKRFDLGYHEHIEELPAELWELTNLQRLTLELIDLYELPSEIGNLTQLIELNLASNRLDEIPSEIGNLTQLVELNLADNDLSELPREIGKLIKLQELNLAYNGRMTLESEISNLINLKNLHLEGTYLEELPPEIEQIPNLTIHWYD